MEDPTSSVTHTYIPICMYLLSYIYIYCLCVQSWFMYLFYIYISILIHVLYLYICLYIFIFICSYICIFIRSHSNIQSAAKGRIDLRAHLSLKADTPPLFWLSSDTGAQLSYRLSFLITCGTVPRVNLWYKDCFSIAAITVDQEKLTRALRWTFVAW